MTGLQPGDLVLLPVPAAAAAPAGSAAPAPRPPRTPTPGPPPLRRRLLRQPPGRLVHRLPRPRRAQRPARRAAPRRLPLRVRPRRSTATASATSTSGRTSPRTRWSRWPTTGSGTRSTSATPTSRTLHAKYPWIITWDDHEVTNDQWGDGAENHDADARATTASAGPARTGRTTSGCRCAWTAPPGSATATRLFRRLRFGRLAELQHARPAHLPQRAGRSPRATRCPAAGPRSATPTAPSPATGSWQWLKDSLRPDRPRSGSWSATR